MTQRIEFFDKRTLDIVDRHRQHLFLVNRRGDVYTFDGRYCADIGWRVIETA